MKLELKHLSPYLPYGLQIKENSGHSRLCLLRQLGYYPENNRLLAEVTLKGLNLRMYYEEFKPILRPLSDLTKEIEHNGERFVPVIELLKPGIQISDASKVKWIGKCIVWQGVPLLCLENLNLSLKQWQLLFSWHFDVLGLIEKGLAIDINSLAGECKPGKKA